MEIIGIYEFAVLEEKAKKDLLYSIGELLTAIEHENEKKLLYYFSNFFVEVSFNDEGIVSITPFKKGFLLEKYLDQIELADLGFNE